MDYMQEKKAEDAIKQKQSNLQRIQHRYNKPWKKFDLLESITPRYVALLLSDKEAFGSLTDVKSKWELKGKKFLKDKEMNHSMWMLTYPN